MSRLEFTTEQPQVLKRNLHNTLDARVFRRKLALPVFTNCSRFTQRSPSNGALVSYQDDGMGNFVAQTPGVLNTLVKDVGNSLWKETMPDGFTAAYPLNTTGQIASISYRQDAIGNRHTFSYSSGLLSTLQDTVGRIVTFGYASGRLESIQDWAGRRTTFQYDPVSASPKNLLTTVIGPTGCQTVYGYATFTLAGPTSDWLLSRITDPNGYATDYSYDQQRRAVSRSVAGVGVTTYLYQPGFMLTVDAFPNKHPCANSRCPGGDHS